MPLATTNSFQCHAESDASKQPAHTTLGAQTQLLLVALRNVIVPLVQTALPNQKGTEAEDFLMALQKYVESIVRGCSASDSDTEETVISKDSPTPPTLTRTREEETPNEDGKVDHEVSLTGGLGAERTVSLEDTKSVILRAMKVYDEGIRKFYSLPGHFLDKALTTLRAHVFNTMPIRLLCVKRRGVDLDITLLDRTGIYSHLMSKLQDRLRTQLQGASLPVQDISVWVSEIAQYTILSHTWLRSSPGEVTFGDWYDGAFDMTHPGYRKLVNFCRVAAEEHDVTLGWMDTVCIDKESSAELDESIRSMCKWYQNAKNCIIYLAETTALSDMAGDPWFTRGWTLQELLAPRYIIFYGAQWTTLGNGLFNDKKDRDIQKQITLATTITPTELMSPLSEASISRKMQWAANRQVTRGEDAAYSLMGIFNVSISIAYGEGADLAFIRLVKEILNTTKSDILDLFNWAGNYKTETSSLVPSSPHAYLRRCAFNWRTLLIEPITITHLGLRIPVVLMPAVSRRSWTPYYLSRNYYSAINIQPTLDQYAALADTFTILGASFFPSPISAAGEPLAFAFAVLNCGGSMDSEIILFKNCFAVAILYTHDNGIVTPTGFKVTVPTKDPIAFQLMRNFPDPWEFDTIPIRKLARSGMQLLTMYF